jgi:hypothetical protein
MSRLRLPHLAQVAHLAACLVFLTSIHGGWRRGVPDRVSCLRFAEEFLESHGPLVRFIAWRVPSLTGLNFVVPVFPGGVAFATPRAGMPVFLSTAGQVRANFLGLLTED